MKSIKKIIALFSVLSIFSFSVAFAAPTKLKVVTTIFPVYDWILNIAGDNVDLTLLQDKGTDMHSWNPSSLDMVKVSTADVFVFVGGVSDKWVDNAMKNAKNKNIKAVNLMEVLGDKVFEEELSEGMQEEHHHEEGEHHGEDFSEIDEHIWLSPKVARILCKNLADILISKDSKNAQIYRLNYKNYDEKLLTLDKNFEDVVKKSAKQKILVADRFPFRYLVEDYDLDYYAAFPGCSAETEASFKTVTFLVSKLNEDKLNCVLVTETSDQKIAKTVISNSKSKNQKILVMDSLQSVSQKQLKDGKNYLNAMHKNLEVLTEALK